MIGQWDKGVVVFFYILLIILLSAPSLGMEEYRMGYPDHIRERFSISGDWGEEEWLFTTLAGTTILLAYTLDEVLQEKIQDVGDIGGSLFTFASPLGHGSFTLLSTGALYLCGYLSRDSLMQTTALLALESFVVSGILVTTLKHTTGRHRPWEGTGKGEWEGPNLQFRYHSFPSGHTTAAFSLATILSLQYQEYPLIPFFAYGLATLVGIGRVYTNSHWVSDVLAGALLGHLTARNIVSAEKRYGIWTPVVRPDGIGLQTTFSW